MFRCQGSRRNLGSAGLEVPVYLRYCTVSKMVVIWGLKGTGSFTESPFGAGVDWVGYPHFLQCSPRVLRAGPTLAQAPALIPVSVACVAPAGGRSALDQHCGSGTAPSQHPLRALSQLLWHWQVCQGECLRHRCPRTRSPAPHHPWISRATCGTILILQLPFVVPEVLLREEHLVAPKRARARDCWATFRGPFES